MKDILKIMWFDFLTASPLALVAYAIATVVCFLLSLFFSPIICGYITFAAIVFVIPLQSIADKSDFHKLYGILPVQRKNITRARFLYVFSIHFVTELLEIVLASITSRLALYKILPNQNSEMMQFIADSFSDNTLMFLVIVGLFALSCLLFVYMEMMGQIFGRESELRTIIITLGVVSGMAFIFFMLADHGIIPIPRLPNFPTTIAGRMILGICMNLILFGVCLLFGEITASQLAKREL